MKKGLLKVAFFGLLLGGLFTMTSCHESPAAAGTDTPEFREVLNTISGTILGSDGTPLANQTVQVTDVNGTVYTTRTDANGYFIIDGLKAGEYTVSVESSDYVAFSKNVTVGNGGQTADIQVLNVVLTKKTEVIENIDLSNGTTGEGATTESGTVLDDSDPYAEDSKVNTTISVTSNTIATDASAGEIADDQIVVTPFYDESAAETRATQEIPALYYGLYIHFASGRSIQNVTLNQPITITFNVNPELVEYMKVKVLNFNNATFEDLNEGVTKKTATGEITISTRKLGYFGLYFDVNENSTASYEGLAISNNTVSGPVENPVLNYSYKVGATLSSGTGSVYAKAFLKNWIVRQFGRSGVKTLSNGRYTANVTLPTADFFLYATGRQNKTDYNYSALGASFAVTAYEDITINYTISERRSHSGGVVTD